MKRLLLLNPQSRNGRAESIFAGQREKWDRLLGAFELYRTSGPGDATRKVREVLREGTMDQIIVAGGDGAIHEAAAGFWDGSTGELIGDNTPLGIINLGTGGDFYRTVNERSSDYESALVDNRSALIDVGNVRSSEGKRTRFLNISSAGLAGEMNKRMKASRFQSGAVAYFYHTVTTLAAYSPKLVTLEVVDDEGVVTTRDASLINTFVCNGCYSGGGMQWAPGASLTDGLLRITCVLGEEKLPLVIHSGKVYKGDIENLPGAETYVGTSFRIRGERAFSLEADGELVGTEETEVRFGIEPGIFPLVG